MKTLLLVSGGYDSYVISALCDSLCYQSHALFFNYGQKAYVKERESVSRLADKFLGRSFRQSDFITEVKVIASWLFENFEKDNYFPMRNFIFLSNALSYAQALGYDMIVTGVNDSENEYADTSHDFMNHIEKVYNSVGIKLWNPLHNMYKGDIYELGTKLGIKLEDTWSCDYSNDIPCGKCGSCLDVKVGIENGYLKK
jgi:7-cyano-7-deazaguanine synthase